MTGPHRLGFVLPDGFLWLAAASPVAAAALILIAFMCAYASHNGEAFAGPRNCHFHRHP